MSDSKPQFAALPNRALWDRRLTDRDVRILAVYAAHDRLSASTGKGQGAWASHTRMAALSGTEYSRFSVATNRLLEFGYLMRERLATDRRKFTYRVIYNEGDSLPSSKQTPPEIVCSDANEPEQIVCSTPELSDCEQTKTDPQYISQSEEIDSAEAVKKILKNQRASARCSSKRKFSENIGGQLAAFERAWKEGGDTAFDDAELTERYNWLFELHDQADPSDQNGQRALRLYYEVDAAAYDRKCGPYAAEAAGA